MVLTRFVNVVIRNGSLRVIDGNTVLLFAIDILDIYIYIFFFSVHGQLHALIR